jgi:phospholipid transport system substrate-binding protein
VKRALALALLIPCAPFAADSPRAVVEKLTTAVLEVLADKAAPAEERRHRIERIVYETVAFDTLSQLVLARHWKDFSPTQRTAFIEEFKRHLSLTYGRDLDSYRNERVAILGEREEVRGDRMVNTKIVRGGADDIQVDYRLRQVDGEWKVIDFIVDHISLVANYRSQFQEILGSGSPDRLIALIRDKNAKGQTLKAPGRGGR